MQVELTSLHALTNCIAAGRHRGHKVFTLQTCLRRCESAVIEAANRREPGTGDDPAAVFGVIRRWKQSF